MIVPIFKGKGDVISCGSFRGVKLLEHAMKIVERVLERRIRKLINLNKMWLGFMPGKGTVDIILLGEESRRNIKRTRNCICVLLTWKKLLIECQEK